MQPLLGGKDAAQAQSEPPSHVCRTFGWQEKVYSQAEVVSAQVGA
jgi:hypothetical protein